MAPTDVIAAADDRVPAAVEVVSEPLGGSPLSRMIQEGRAPAHWRVAPPADLSAWGARIEATRAAFAGRTWLAPLAPAIRAPQRALDRLSRVARQGGILITTGQQPGLFGGPLYTWSKALTALALADAIEALLGVPSAPLFWAATDDADLVEAQSVWVATAAGAVRLRGRAVAPAGTPAADVPQGSLDRELEVLRDASGAGASHAMLDAVAAAYGDPDRTIGAAYLDVLETTLGPLGIPVLDAAHPAVTAAGMATLHAALDAADAANEVLRVRAGEIRARGMAPQVDEVPGLTTVFVYEGDGTKRRIPVAEARGVRARGDARLGANVLLRPVMEGELLPTAAYVAGPGELAYFAQVTALAAVIGARLPVAVPRWSGTLVEPRMQRLLARLGVAREALAEPDRVESALARAAIPLELRGAVAQLEAALGDAVARVRAADGGGLVPDGVLEGLHRRLTHHVAQLERRLASAVKRRDAAVMQDVARARGFFFPGGQRQERALSPLPTLARHGPGVLDTMYAEASRHAQRLLRGEA